MIKPSFLVMLFLAAVAVGTGQNTRVNSSLARARYLVSEKMYADAVSTLENRNPEGSDPMIAALTMGKALSGLKRFGDSNLWLLRVSGAGAAEANYILAKNYLALNDIPSAIDYLGKHLADKNHYPEKEIKLDPDFSKLENNREWVRLWQTEWYSSAEQQAAECEYLISRNLPDEAEDLVRRVLSGNPDEPRALFLQARIHFQRKEDRLFKSSLERAWQLAGENRLLQEDMLRFTLEVKQYEKLNSMASELIRKDPSNPEYLITRALVRILDGQESLALKEIDAMEEAGISPAELYYQAGRKMSASMPSQAESYLTKAIATGNMDARFYFTRGTVRVLLEKAELALGDLAMSLDINPYQPDLYFARAQIRMDMGDTEGACHDWRKAMEMGNPKAPDLLYKFCRLP